MYLHIEVYVHFLLGDIVPHNHRIEVAFQARHHIHKEWKLPEPLVAEDREGSSMVSALFLHTADHRIGLDVEISLSVRRRFRAPPAPGLLLLSRGDLSM